MNDRSSPICRGWAPGMRTAAKMADELIDQLQMDFGNRALTQSNREFVTAVQSQQAAMSGKAMARSRARVSSSSSSN